MKPEDVRAALGALPHMTLEQGRTIAAFIREHRLRDCLELGFYHGVSSAYIAGALEDLGGGSLVCVDTEYARGLAPNIEETLGRVGLRDRVTWHYEPTSYVFRLMRMLEESPEPRFDLCYLDGAHTWQDDGLAALLAERLLRPGGWLLLDDLDWTFADSPTLRETERVRRMPRAEREMPQVRKVYELLVKTHPRFDTFRVEGPWAYARKSVAADGAPPAVRREVVVQSRWLPSLGAAYARLSDRVRRTVARPRN